MNRNQNVKHSNLWNMFWRDYDKLAIAARNGTSEDCEKLLKEGWKLDAKDKLGRTPLMISTQNPNIDVFRFLLKSGANINVVDDNGQGILEHTIANSKLELVKEIVDKIKVQFNNCNENEYKKYVKSYNIRNNLAKNNKFLSYLFGIDLDNPTFQNEPVNIPYVFLAAWNPDLRVLDFLEENGCDLSIGMKDDTNIFTQALESNPNPDVIDYLIKKNLFIHNSDLIYQFIVYNDSIDVWKKIFEIGIPKDNRLLYLLLAKKDNPNPEIVALLADEKSLKIKTDTYTPVLLAVEKSDPIYLKILKEAGADLNEKNDYGVSPLMSACSFNPNIEITNYLIENGADISERDFQGNDVLMFSIVNPNLEIAKRLIELGADIHTKTKDEQENILMMALRKGANLEKVDYILSLGIDINEKTQRGYTAINYAANYNPYVEVLDYLINKGADVKYVPNFDPNFNLLFCAAANKNSDIIKYLIYKGLNIKARSRDGKTPLLVAATNSNLDVLYTLIQAGADIKDVDNDHNNALLMAAAYNENCQIIPQLLRAGFSLDDRNVLGENAFILATKNRNPEVFQVLMFNSRISSGNKNEKYYLNSTDIYGNTVLMHAIMDNNIDVIKLLIDKGVDINAKTPENITALMLAVTKFSDSSIIELLINAGADINVEDDEGFDCLKHAVFKNYNPEIIKLLINKGLNVKKIYRNGFTLAHYAAYNPNPQIMELLIENWVDFDRKQINDLKNFAPVDFNFFKERDNNKYLTPLAIAAEFGTPEVCEVLIKAGARLEARDMAGLTPLILSVKNRNPEVFRLLLKYGADINVLDYMKQGIFNAALIYSNLELVKEIAELTKVKFHNYNYEIYIKNRFKMQALRQRALEDEKFYQTLLSVGIEPFYPKEKKLPYIFLAALNPDLRVLEFLEEKGCDLSLGTKEENVVSYALSGNSNPNIIEYLIAKKLLVNDAFILVSNLRKNPSLDVWKRLFEMGVSKYYQFAEGQSLLMALFGQDGYINPYIVDLLADEKSVNLKANDGRTVCHYMTDRSDLVYYEILKKAGAKFNEKDNFLITPLMFACRENINPEVIDFLIENGNDIKECDSRGNNALLWAMGNSNLEVIKHLIDLGADIHSKNRNGENILMTALMNKANLETINYIISLGINVNEKDNYGVPAIAFAATYNPFPEVFDLLIKKGEDINYKNKDNVNLLHLAASGNSSEKVIEYLIDKGIKIESLTSKHETPLILAVSRNPNFNVFKKLLDKGANIRDTDRCKSNLLHFAAGWNENPVFIDYLLNNGFSINDKDSSGNTPVIYAAQNSNINIVKILVEKGADLKSANDYGLTPLFLCSNGDLGNNIEMARYLIEKGVDVNAKTEEGRTALMQAACTMTDPEYIELLIAAGADVFAETNNGYNAYKVAVENNPNPAIAETIKKYMTMASFKESPFNFLSAKDIN